MKDFMKKMFAGLFLFICYPVIACDQSHASQDKSLQEALLSKVDGLKNSREIVTMTNQVDSYKQQYNSSLQQRQQKNAHDNTLIQDLESKIASYDAQALIKDFMINPDATYYHKTSQWPDEMHNLTFEVIKSRSALKRDRNSIYWQNKVQASQAALLSCMQAGGVQYIYPKERAIEIQQLSDIEQSLQQGAQAQLKLSEQCKMLNIVSCALMSKKEDRQLYLENSWQNFTKNLVVLKTAQEKQQAEVQELQLQKSSQLVYNFVVQAALRDLAQEVVEEQLQSAHEIALEARRFAHCDKKALNLASTCLKEAVKELTQEQVQAESYAQKAAQNEKIACEKAKAKAKKERQKQNKQAASQAASQAAAKDDAFLDEMIAQNAAEAQGKVEPLFPVVSILDAARNRRDTMNDLIKKGFKGDRLRMAMLDYDLHHLDILHGDQEINEQSISKFLLLFENLLKLPLFETELLLQETVEYINILDDELRKYGKDLLSYANKKDEICRLMNLKLDELRVACRMISRVDLANEMIHLTCRENFLKAELESLTARMTIAVNKKNTHEIAALNLQFSQNEVALQQLARCFLENNRKCKMIFTIDVLCRLQCIEGSYRVFGEALQVAMPIGKISDAILQNYRHELEQQCISCITRNGKICPADIQPLMLNILDKTALTIRDKQDICSTMIETALINNNKILVLTSELKQELFNYICAQNKRASKSYDIHLSADLAEIQFVLMETLQKIM